MEHKQLELSESFVQKLLAVPENGMGYQLVDVFLKGGKVLRHHIVLNASVLLLEPNEEISEKEIENIELEK